MEPSRTKPPKKRMNFQKQKNKPFACTQPMIENVTNFCQFFFSLNRKVVFDNFNDLQLTVKICNNQFYQMNFLKIQFCYINFRFHRGEHMDSIGIQSHAMEMNGSARHRSPLPPPPNTLINGNGTVEQWTKLNEPTNGQDQVTCVSFS